MGKAGQYMPYNETKTGPKWGPKRVRNGGQGRPKKEAKTDPKRSHRKSPKGG